ncbi:MAG: 5-formyltetrahydrofolate cyclo-ligase [Pseudomonadota bacterium]
MDSREELRKKLRTQRANLRLNDQVIASQKMTERLIKDSLFQKNQRIAAYLSINYEINPENIVKKAWESHKHCYLPVLQEKKLIFSAYEENTPLNNNRFNIPEPPLSTELIINPCDLDLVLVPLLGFTIKGERLGMGGGFYDRSFHFLLKNPRPIKPFLIGLAYEWQKLETLETKNWDVPLDAVVTEERTYLFTFCL